jgi:hypothetical protein
LAGAPHFRTLEAVTLRDAQEQREQLVDYADAVRGLRISALNTVEYNPFETH